MKEYLQKRIAGLVTGVKNTDAKIAELEKLLLKLKADRDATYGAAQEAERTLAELEAQAKKDAEPAKAEPECPPTIPFTQN